MDRARFIAAIAVLAASAAARAACAATYEELLDTASAADPSIERLTAAEGRAKIALDRALLAHGSPAFAAGTGEASASFADSGTVLSAAPNASCEFPGRVSIGFSAPLSISDSASFAKPGATLGIPLIRGPDESLVALERARDAYEAARQARLRAELELERRLVAALGAVLDRRADSSRAARAEASALRELERAVQVDGAEPGGLSYMERDRDLRSARRASRDARAAMEAALYELRSILGPSAREGLDLVPDSFPEPDMGAALPPPESCYLVMRAESAARLDRLADAEADRRTVLGLELGGAYRLGEGASAADPEGLDLSAGLRASLGRSGIEVAAGGSWNPDAGPGASLSLSWKPAPRGDEGLRRRDRELAESLRGMDVKDALAEARKAIAALEDRRRALAEADRDAEEDLAAAEAQASIYEARRELGLVGHAEYAEVIAALDECRARFSAAALDRIAWSVDSRLLRAIDIGGAE